MSTRDYKFEYWKEALEIALDEVGAANVLTPEQIEQVAGSLEISADNQGMAFGHDAIPNPMKAEVAAAVRRIDTARKEADDRESALRSQIDDLRYTIRDLQYKLAEAREAR